jgi:hypothetical protein
MGGDEDPSVVLGLGLAAWAVDDLERRRSIEKELALGPEGGLAG